MANLLRRGVGAPARELPVGELHADMRGCGGAARRDHSGAFSNQNSASQYAAQRSHFPNRLRGSVSELRQSEILATRAAEGGPSWWQQASVPADLVS